MRKNIEALVGVDTPFLVAHTIREHPRHERALEILSECLQAGRRFALCGTVIDEFIHAVTDPKRFESPVPMDRALRIAQTWLQSKEVTFIPVTEASARLHLQWMAEYRLGRKRINDTRIAATYYSHGLRRLLTSNPRDYSVLNAFEVVEL